MESKAREALPENVSTLEEIEATLKEKLKPDNSKIIAGKTAALTLRNNNFIEFTKQRAKLTKWRLGRQYQYVVLMQDQIRWHHHKNRNHNFYQDNNLHFLNNFHGTETFKEVIIMEMAVLFITIELNIIIIVTNIAIEINQIIEQ